MGLVINPYIFKKFSPVDNDPLQYVDGETGVYTDGGVTLAGNNDTVQQWNDQTANNEHLLQTVLDNKGIYKTNQINGQAVVEFDGANDFMQNLSAGAVIDGEDQPVTIGLVFKCFTTTAGSPHALAKSSPLNIYRPVRHDGAGNYTFTKRDEAGAFVVHTYGTADLNPHQVIIEDNGTTADLYLDQVKVLNGVNTNLGVMSITAEFLGKGSFPGDVKQCQIGALYMKGSSDAAEAAKLRAFWLEKYGV